MEDYSDELYFERKAYYLEAMRKLKAGVGTRVEDEDAFLNAIEDSYFDEA